MDGPPVNRHKDRALLVRGFSIAVGCRGLPRPLVDGTASLPAFLNPAETRCGGHLVFSEPLVAALLFVRQRHLLLPCLLAQPSRSCSC